MIPSKSVIPRKSVKEVIESVVEWCSETNCFAIYEARIDVLKFIFPDQSAFIDSMALPEDAFYQNVIGG